MISYLFTDLSRHILCRCQTSAVVYSIQHDKICQLLATCRRIPPPIKLTSRYNWIIVESGVKHHNSNPQTSAHIGVIFFWCRLFYGRSEIIVVIDQFFSCYRFFNVPISGADPGGGGGAPVRCAPPPLLKLEKIWFFGVKS